MALWNASPMSEHSPASTVNRNHATWLAVLLVLFVFRVLAQLLQTFFPVPFLPPFDAWQSGALPYPLLVISQLIIIAVALTVIRRIRMETLSQQPAAGVICIGLGIIYLAVMVFRLYAGQSFAADHPWLGVLLPTLFHLVLAGFLLSVGAFLNPLAWRRLVPWLVYPVTMLCLVSLFLVLRYRQVNLQVATYLPVTLGALAIIALEFRFPYRREWLPERADVFNDATYMVVVQVLLPRFLSFFVAITLLNAMGQTGLTLTAVWPTGWPIVAQVLLMMVSAEFFRYWLHRLAHVWQPLWRLHAVHHSPHKLYWMNVSRFHPLEKAIQFLFDSLPFILLGVGEEVLALYFVFYSINGFFQHCNIELRMGLLNYLISGPELHRWHHSKLIRESNTNYGNNLIIWDLLFGSWFLPRDRGVGELGLINRRYPLQFLAQLKTPFVAGLDKRS
jgi:sterol desaturase/sphingolipid hydroxylase (fatty acid hydroxylase superfamily)